MACYNRREEQVERAGEEALGRNFVLAV